MAWIKFGIGLCGAGLVAFCATNNNPPGCPYKLGALGVVIGVGIAWGMFMSIVNSVIEEDEAKFESRWKGK